MQISRLLVSLAGQAAMRSTGTSPGGPSRRPTTPAEPAVVTNVGDDHRARIARLQVGETPVTSLDLAQDLASATEQQIRQAPGTASMAHNRLSADRVLRLLS